MFREEYIKANQKIKPDDDFLKRLKESVVQEDAVIHIGDYVDWENVTSINDVENVPSVKDVSMKRRFTWKNIAVIAACFVFVCTLSFVASKMDIVNGNKGLQAGMESVIRGDDTAEKKLQSTELQEQYQTVRKMFDTMNVVIYETDKFAGEESGMKYLQDLYGSESELDSSDRDELIENIVAGQYTVKDSLEEFDNAKYYVAEFEDRSCVCFAVDEKYIYIAQISGIQRMAAR